MKFVAHHGNVRPARGQRLTGKRTHVVPEAVILIQQIDLLHGPLASDHVGQRVHAHARVGVEAEMPEAAAGTCERRVVGRIIEKKLAIAGLAGVVLVDGRDERGRDRRAIALQDERDAAVSRGPLLHERLLHAAAAVHHDEFERMPPVGERDAAARIHALDAETQIALDGRARIGERPRHALDERQPHRLRRSRSGAALPARSGGRDGPRAQDGDRGDAANPSAHRLFLLFDRSADHRLGGCGSASPHRKRAAAIGRTVLPGCCPTNPKP